MRPAVLEISNVSLSLRGAPILEDINLSLAQGDFVGLIGPNGAGKTVLLKVILGLIQPDRGTVQVFGKPPARARGRVGYVPQHASFEASFPISVFDVVLMGRLKRSKAFWPFGREDRDIAMNCLEAVEMADLARRQIGRLSGGQLQRVLIARALAARPEMLLLDEPTASLDTNIGRAIYDLLGRLAAEMTILLVSHDIGVISAHVKTIACLNKRLYYHSAKQLSDDVLQAVYGCPIELIAHGHAHRVLAEHERGEK